jgi:hypothetical protein
MRWSTHEPAGDCLSAYVELIDDAPPPTRPLWDVWRRPEVSRPADQTFWLGWTGTLNSGEFGQLGGGFTLRTWSDDYQRGSEVRVIGPTRNSSSKAGEKESAGRGWAPDRLLLSILLYNFHFCLLHRLLI